MPTHRSPEAARSAGATQPGLRGACAAAAAAPRYGEVAIALHWVLALALCACFGGGLALAGGAALAARLLRWHQWAGVSILALSLFRLAWRAGHRPPEPPAQLGRGRRRLAGAVHGAMYALFLLVPLAGWAYCSAAGMAVVWVARLPMPAWGPPDAVAAAAWRGGHAVLAALLAACAALHVGLLFEQRRAGAALVFQRMLPLRRDREEEAN